MNTHCVSREVLPGQAAIGELRAATLALQGRQDAGDTRVAAVQSESASLRANLQVRADQALSRTRTHVNRSHSSRAATAIQSESALLAPGVALAKNVEGRKAVWAVTCRKRCGLAARQ